jgi:signal transduction histidine kinase
MDITAHCPLATSLAVRMRDARDELTGHWLDRISARVAIDRNTVFPTEELLDHVPLLIAGVADYLEDPAREVSADVPVVAKAMELGELRHAQGFDAYEILKEYEILGSILFSFLARVVGDLEDPCSRPELLVCAHRVFRAIAIIQESTTIQFLRKTSERVREREARLRTFNHAISHELKNHLHSAIGASQLLEEGLDADPDAQRRLLGVISRNLALMNGRLEGLLELTRIDDDARRQRHVFLPQAAAESARLLRETAAARGVSIRLASDLPRIEVHAAAVELALSNYLSNAIKYCDPAKPDRWAEVRGSIREYAGGACDLVVEVQDNGLGVPPDARTRLFARFSRAHESVADSVEGMGLGLSIVRETVESLGGRAWAEFPAEGSVFAFSLPCRRESDTCGESDAPPA